MNIASLFNLAGPDLIIILLIVLLLFGAKKLPELAKGLGQGIKEFKKATGDASAGLREAVENTLPGPRRLPAAPANTERTARE